MAYKFVLGLITVMWGLALLLLLPTRIFHLIFWLVSQEPEPGKTFTLFTIVLPIMIPAASIIFSWVSYHSKSRNWKTFSIAAFFPLPLLILSSTYSGFFLTEGFGMLSPSKYFRPVAKLNGYYEDNGSKRMAAVLADGRIALVGGRNIDLSRPVGQAGSPLRAQKVALFDPSTNKITELPDIPLAVGILGLNLTPLSSNDVLITSEEFRNYHQTSESKNSHSEDKQTNQRTTAILLQPDSRQYQSLHNFRPVRCGASLAALPEGHVLVLGGVAGNEEFDLQKKEGRYPPKPLHNKLTAQEVKVLEDWQRAHHKMMTSVQVFDPKADAIKTVAQLPYTHEIFGQTISQVDKNRFLLIGGTEDADPTALTYNKEIYLLDLTRKSISRVGILNFPREHHYSIPIDGTHYLIVGGTNQNRSQVTVEQRVPELELLNLNTGKTKVVGSISGNGSVKPARLPDGRILLVSDDKVELYDPERENVRVIDTFRFPRKSCLIISTQNGNVYRIGGTGKRDSTDVDVFDYSSFQKSE